MAKYKLQQKTNANGTTQDIQLDASCVDLSGCVKTDGTSTMTGKLQLKAGGNDNGGIGSNGICWDSSSLPQDNNPQYICTIDAFASGGKQKWTTLASLKTNLAVPTSYVSSVDGNTGAVTLKTINNNSLIGSGNITISGGQATDVRINGTSITSSNVADIKTNGTYNATSNKIATMSDIPNLSGYYPKSGGALNNDAVITMTGSNPYIGLQETGGTQYYLQGYQGEVGISVSGNWGTKRLSLDANGKVLIPSKSIGDGTYTYTLPSKTGTIALTSDVAPQLSGYTFTLKSSITTTKTATSSLGLTKNKIYFLVPYSLTSSIPSIRMATGGATTLNNASSAPIFCYCKDDTDYGRTLWWNLQGSTNNTMITHLAYCKVYEVTIS